MAEPVAEVPDAEVGPLHEGLRVHKLIVILTDAIVVMVSP